MHNSRTWFLLVLQICLLAAMLRGHAFDAHAFESGSTPAIVIGQNLSSSLNVTANTVNSPEGLAFDRAGDLWIVDGMNDRVLEFVPPFRSNMNASLVLGQPNFHTSYFTETAWQQLQSQYQVGPNIFNGVAAVGSKENVWK